jgi:hypothetical protein
VASDRAKHERPSVIFLDSHLISALVAFLAAIPTGALLYFMAHVALMYVMDYALPWSLFWSFVAVMTGLGFLAPVMMADVYGAVWRWMIRLGKWIWA